MNLTSLLSMLLFVFGLVWLSHRIEQHPFVQRWRALRKATPYWRSAIDEIPSRWELAKPHLVWLLVALLWIFMFLTKSLQPGDNFMLFFGILAFLIGASQLVLDQLARRHRALELSSAGICYLEQHFDLIPWEEIVLVLDYQQSIIIKSEEHIYEFTFDNDPADHQRLLAELKQMEERLGKEISVRKVEE
jgi:hypothetical protein